MEFKDYYAILGVKADADGKVIKTAYRKLARKYHPDMNPDPGAEDKFKEVAEAYEVLKKPERRAKFDELRRNGQQSKQGFQPPPGRQAGGGFDQSRGHFEGDFSEFFNSMFGEQFRHVGAQARNARGADAEIEMPILLEETLHETQKTVEYQIPVTERGVQQTLKKHLKVKIPKGVMDGARIRVKGQGIPSHGQGPAGDLYLHIRLVPHPLFDVQGHDLLLTLPLAPWEAALGAKVTLPTLEGKITLTIVANTPTGKRLRIKGKGLQGNTVTGDLYAIVKVVMPPSHNEQARALWQTLSETQDFNPRAEWSHSQ